MNKICILGLGYIGLPTASLFATHGVRVVGVDNNPNVVEVLRRGNVHIEEKGLEDLVESAIASGNLVIEMTPGAADAFIIAVPTPINSDKTADIRAVTAATTCIVPYLRPGNLVVLESTSPPGTTMGLVKPILETSGLQAGSDFLLAYSPERVLPGQLIRELIENARVIGGIDRASAEAARDLYARFARGEIMLTDATTAEMVKLMENTFRDVNVALANELALIAEKLHVNIWNAIELANHHPRVKILRPGPGVGGHCIPVDPWFLVEVAPQKARLIRQARLVNDEMPDHVVDQVRQAVSEIARPVVACLGLSYKADVDDTRESPALEIVRKLVDCGCEVRTFDPHVKSLPSTNGWLAPSVAAAVAGADLLLLLVDHAEFKVLVPDTLAGMHGRRVLDTRNCLDIAAWQQSGFAVDASGRV